MPLKVNYQVRVSVLLAIVLVLALLCSAGALLTAREVEGLMAAMISRNVPSLVAATELENSLLQQRGLVSAYMLDEGRQGWILDLDRLKPSLGRWLVEARRTADTDEEQKIVALLEEVYKTYDAQREEAIALFEAGRHAEARQILLRDVSLLSNQAHDLCRQLVAANERQMRLALVQGHRRLGQLTVAVIVGASAAVLVALTLLLMVLLSILRPMQRLAQDAKALTADSSETTPPHFPDELREFEFYSRALMSDMTRTRSSLEDSRQRLLTAEKLAAIGKFAACVAHEIRNPLTSMRIWLYDLQRSAAGDPETEQKCRMLADEVARLEEMATSFLQLSRPPNLKLAPQDVGAIIDRALEFAGHRLDEKRLRAVRVNGEVLPPVLADADQLRQVFLNLLTNAADATPAGGELRVTDAIECPGDGGRVVVVRVEDGGPGVPEKVRGHLFEPFVTTKANGTGLGLCIASSIMAKHGGRLSLESSTERGCVFAVRIPVCEG